MEGDEATVLLFIQGKLKPGAEEVYQQYVRGTGPLLAEYGAEVVVVGSGTASDWTSDVWPINAVLRFPNRAAGEGFLSDSRYLALKKNYRDLAYETLHLTLVDERKPAVRTPKDVALEAFESFRQGITEGHWEPFLDRLSPEFTLRFPSGPYQGVNRGVDTARKFFDYFNAAFPDGLEIVSLDRVTAEGETVVFEFEDRGELRGTPYENWVAISLDVCGEQICGYREYFGKVGPPPNTEASGGQSSGGQSSPGDEG